MAETLREFLVSFQFAAGDSARAEADAAAAAKRVTATDAAALGQREKNALDAIGRMAGAYDKARTETDKKNSESEKRSRDARDAAFKQTSEHAVRMGVVATRVVASVTGAATAVFWATEQAAKSMDRINFMSQRTGASAGGISAFAYAASQTGSSVEEANASLEKFGDNLKRFPQAYEGALKNLGIQTRDVNGNMRETSKLADDLVKKIATMPRAQRSVQGQFFGLSEGVIQAGARPEFQQRYDERQAINDRMGFDPEKAAAGGTAFEQSMRRLDAVLGSIKDKVTSGLFNSLQPQIDKLATWALENGPHVADVFLRIANELAALAGAVLDKLAKVDWDGIVGSIENFAKKFDQIARQYFGVDGITAVFDAFGAVLAVSVLARLTSIIGAMTQLAAITPAAWLLRALGLGAGAAAALPLLGTAAVGAVLASGDPNKALLDGGRPDLQPQDNDLGLPGIGEDRKSGLGDAKQKASSFWDYIKEKAKGLGFGDRLPGGSADDRLVKDATLSSAESLRKLVEKSDRSDESGGGGPVGSGEGGGTSNLRYGRGRGGHYRGTPGTGQDYESGPKVSLGKMGNKFAEKAPVIMDGLMKKYSLTREQAAGVVGNLGHESAGFTAYHEGGQASTKGGVGWAQWTGSRRHAFEAWTKAHGLDPTSDEASWRYLTEGDPETAGAIAAVKGTRTRRDATRAFHDKFERSADINNGVIVKQRSWNSRLRYADEAFAGTPAGATVSQSQPSGQSPVPAGTSAKAIGDAEVFAARQRIINGSRDPKDHALVDQYRAQQNTPVSPAAKKEWHQSPLQFTPGGGANALTSLYGAGFLKHEPTVKISEESLHKLGRHVRERTTGHPLTSHAAQHAVHTSSRVFHLQHNPTYHLGGGHTDTQMAAAQRSSSRGQQDMLRNIQSMET